jgi:hypothetical protein
MGIWLCLRKLSYRKIRISQDVCGHKKRIAFTAKSQKTIRSEITPDSRKCLTQNQSIMSKFVFTYSIIAWTKRNPSKRVAAGGAWSADGARRVIESLRKDGAKVSHAIVMMHEANKPLDWNNPVSERKVYFKKEAVG